VGLRGAGEQQGQQHEPQPPHGARSFSVSGRPAAISVTSFAILRLLRFFASSKNKSGSVCSQRKRVDKGISSGKSDLFIILPL
ncbi:hypothetical protein KC976_04080, partial [Candidatus Saccharibacteria bacterium]|nr:hypothetical protein [Candidatus Saccharibacteria bacterium]